MKRICTLTLLLIFALCGEAQDVKMQGMEMVESMNDEGTALVKMPFKWYAGIGSANDKQTAIELAQREAYASISRILNDAVLDVAERGNVVNEGDVKKALKLHWEQVSSSLLKGCEPFGEAKVEYDGRTGMYTATARVAIRGDRFVKLLNTAGSFKPENLSGNDLKEFNEVNESIMEAAKGE